MDKPRCGHPKVQRTALRATGRRPLHKVEIPNWLWLVQNGQEQCDCDCCLSAERVEHVVRHTFGFLSINVLVCLSTKHQHPSGFQYVWPKQDDYETTQVPVPWRPLQWSNASLLQCTNLHGMPGEVHRHWQAKVGEMKLSTARSISWKSTIWQAQLTKRHGAEAPDILQTTWNQAQQTSFVCWSEAGHKSRAPKCSPWRNTTRSCSKMYQETRKPESQRPSASEIVCLRLWRSLPPHIGPLWTVQDPERQREHWRSSWSSLQDLQPTWAQVSSNSEFKKDVQLQAVAPYSHPKRTAMWQDRLLSLDKMSLTSMKATNRNICLPGSGQVWKPTSRADLQGHTSWPRHMRFMAEDPGNTDTTSHQFFKEGNHGNHFTTPYSASTLKLSSTFQEWSNNATDADDLSSLSMARTPGIFVEPTSTWWTIKSDSGIIPHSILMNLPVRP